MPVFFNDIAEVAPDDSRVTQRRNMGEGRDTHMKWVR
jgi:hypothetical protein